MIKPNNKQIDKMLATIESNINNVHPDNPMSFLMAQRYRELTNLKNQ